MPSIKDVVSIDPLRDMIFMFLSPRDVVNYQTATGIKLTAIEFERYVNVFRFIIPHRNWLLDKVRNEGYAFVVVCRDLYHFPDIVTNTKTYHMCLIVTNKDGDLVSCDEGFMSDSLFESAELDIRVLRCLGLHFSSIIYRQLTTCHGRGEDRVVIGLLTSRASLPSLSNEQCRSSDYSGPMLRIPTNCSVFEHICFEHCEWYDGVFSKSQSPETQHDSCRPTMYAIMDSDGYTVQHSYALCGIPAEELYTRLIFPRKRKMRSSDPGFGASSSWIISGASLNSSSQQEDTKTLFTLVRSGNKSRTGMKDALIYQIKKPAATGQSKYQGLLNEPIFLS